MTDGRASTQKRVLVVYDGTRGPSATQTISFGRPFDSPAGDSPFRIVFEHGEREAELVRTAFASQAPQLLVLSRYTSPNGSEWIRLARDAHIPVIFHVDDDLLAVPTSLGEAKFKTYNNPERLAALRRNIDGSDLLYVSTAELERRYKEHRVALPMVAGDVYCSVPSDDIGALLAPATGPVIGYMGTSGHAADLALVLPVIYEIMDAAPTVQFELFGTIQMPPQLERFGRRSRCLRAAANYSEFMSSLRSLGWWVGLAPLEDNSFNRCKADTKWVEYSAAGIPVVASDLPVYHRAAAGGAAVLADTAKSWNEALLTLLRRPDLRRDQVAIAQEKLRRSYTHDRVRRQVTSVFEQALASAAA